MFCLKRRRELISLKDASIRYVTLHAAPPRSITEISPKSPFFCVNRGVSSGIKCIQCKHSQKQKRH